MPNNPEWPIGRLATKVILFTRENNSDLEIVLKTMHAQVQVLHPDENAELSAKYSITSLPVMIFLYHESIIHRVDF